MRLAVVFDYPRERDPFRHGVTAAYLSGCLAAVERETGETIDARPFYAVMTRPLGKEPKIGEVRAERDRLMNELRAWRPDKIVTLGKSALNAVAIDAPKALAISKERGRMRTVLGTPWVPTISPYAVIAKSDLHRDFVHDLWKVVRQPRPLPPLDIELIVPTGHRELQDALDLLEEATVVGVDVETSGLRPATDQTLALGLGAVSGDDYGLAVVVTRELLANSTAVDMIWDSVWRRTRRSIGHNFKFDMQFLAPLIGFPPDGASLGDTLLLGHLLDERPNRPDSRVRGLGLKDMVAVRYDHQYGFDFGEFYQSEVPDWDAMHAYLGEDVCYTARLWHDLVAESEAESPNLLRCHDDLLMPVSVALARAEFRGAPVSVPWIEDTLRAYDLRIARRQRVLEATIADLTSRPEVNIGAPQQVADIMYDDWRMTPDVRKKGKLLLGDRSTDKDHLKAAVSKYRGTALDREARWLHTLSLWRRDVRQRTTVQKSLLDKVDPDGRVRASFLIHGTSTGRLSSQGPNLQNIPAIDREDSLTFRPMRRAFQPESGFLWAEVDYSQLELRVAAALSQDPDFIEVFRSGRDVHTEIATGIFAKPADQISKSERFLAKAVAFGILYGRGPEALATGAEARYVEQKLGGTPWSVMEAEYFRDAFLDAYPKLHSWMRTMHRDVPRAGYVESEFGRRRRFPLYPSSRHELGSIERQAINTPVQSAASDICLQAMVELDRRLEDFHTDAQILFTVHDSICVEVGAGSVKEVETLARDVMEKDWLGVPLRVDFEVGPTWADVKELT